MHTNLKYASLSKVLPFKSNEQDDYIRWFIFEEKKKTHFRIRKFLQQREREKKEKVRKMRERERERKEKKRKMRERKKKKKKKKNGG